MSKWRERWLVLSMASLLSMGAAYLACSSDNKDDDSEKKTILIPILVQQDDFFETQKGELIGRVEYRKSRGPTGSRVDAVCTIDRLSSYLEAFNSQHVNVRLELRNQDAIRATFEPIEWEQDSNDEDFSFYVPLVETVPVLLNFRVLVYQYGDNASGDDDTEDDDSDDDDTGDDDTSDDDTTDDDTEEDATPEGPIFEATADLVFSVTEGQPGIGD